MQQYNIDQLKIYFRKSWKVVFNGIVISVKNEQLVKQMARTILQEELAKVRTGFDKVIQMARTILLEELATKVRTGFDKWKGPLFWRICLKSGLVLTRLYKWQRSISEGMIYDQDWF